MEQMKQLIGVIIELIGVVILVAYSQMTRPSNTLLIVALVLVFAGLVAQVVLNKISKK